MNRFLDWLAALPPVALWLVLIAWCGACFALGALTWIWIIRAVVSLTGA